MNKRGPKRKVDYDAVITYARENPSATQAEVAKQFHTTAWTVGEILRSANIKGIHRGAPIKRHPAMSDEEYAWEQTLHAHGLGMGRGLKIGRSPIYYGFDPKKEAVTDESATAIAHC